MLEKIIASALSFIFKPMTKKLINDINIINAPYMEEIEKLRKEIEEHKKKLLSPEVLDVLKRYGQDVEQWKKSISSL